jgi:hypothetical protein
LTWGGLAEDPLLLGRQDPSRASEVIGDRTCPGHAHSVMWNCEGGQPAPAAALKLLRAVRGPRATRLVPMLAMRR